jgi:hypothetical protein
MTDQPILEVFSVPLYYTTNVIIFAGRDDF